MQKFKTHIKMNLNVETMTVEKLQEALTLSMQINKILMTELSWVPKTASKFVLQSYFDPKIEILKPASREKVRDFLQSLESDYTLTGSVVDGERKKVHGLLEGIKF